MKKFLTAFTFAMMVIVASPISTLANDPKTTTEANAPKNAEARSAQILQRLEEIKAMDKESLSRTERKQLRKEVREIKKEMKANNGIYLSVGAIIIILLVLILIL